jgi:hypothetical protein
VDIKPGATAEIGLTVTEDKTAHAMGNRGVHVFATPYVIGLLEDAAGAVMRPALSARWRIGRHDGGDEASRGDPRRHEGAREGDRSWSRTANATSSQSRRGTRRRRSPRDGTSGSSCPTWSDFSPGDEEERGLIRV